MMPRFLAGNGKLSFDSLMEYWREYHSQSGARLILILDTNQSHPWTRQVRSLSEDYVAIQTCKLNNYTADDLEDGPKVTVGHFTSEWVEYNCRYGNQATSENAGNWLEKDRPVKAIFGTSRCWTDFTFHLPNTQDMELHWDVNFPKITKPLIKVTNFPKIGDLCFCCYGFIRCLRRKRMMWLPPLELHTGHGFSLVRN